MNPGFVGGRTLRVPKILSGGLACLFRHKPELSKDIGILGESFGSHTRLDFVHCVHHKLPSGLHGTKLSLEEDLSFFLLHHLEQRVKMASKLR